MGFNTEKNFLNKFLINSCQILRRVETETDPILGTEIDEYTFETQTGNAITIIPCRKEPAVSHNRDEDKKVVRNKQTIYATHVIWVREEIEVEEYQNIVFNINGDGKYYDILFVNTYPDMPGRNTKDIIVAEQHNDG